MCAASVLLMCDTAWAPPPPSSFDNPADTSDSAASQQFTPPTAPPGSGANPQRRDMPNDPDYDPAEPDNTPSGPTTFNFFDEDYGLFGFPSALTANSAKYADSVHGHAVGDPQVSGFNASGAWKKTRGLPGVSVAILDTGIKWDRCGLRDQIRL